MPVSFPGIDPFVEASGDWPDFHVTFMNVWREAIAEQLPDAYVARLEERLSVITHEEHRERRPQPDIAVSRDHSAAGAATATLSVATLDAVMNRITVEEEIRQTYIQILHHPDRKLVAVLELLSPSNKTGEGRTQYLAKRQEVLMSEAHLVELDLLIDGKRLPLDRPSEPSHFRSVIFRAGQRPNCDVYSWSLDHSMPALPVPLLPPDADIVVGLASVLATTYQRGRYGKTIKYDAPLSLPLAESYQEWVQQQLAR